MTLKTVVTADEKNERETFFLECNRELGGVLRS